MSEEEMLKCQKWFLMIWKNYDFWYEHLNYDQYFANSDVIFLTNKNVVTFHLKQYKCGISYWEKNFPCNMEPLRLTVNLSMQRNKTFGFVYIVYSIPLMHCTLHLGIRHHVAWFAKQKPKIVIAFLFDYIQFLAIRFVLKFYQWSYYHFKQK